MGFHVETFGNRVDTRWVGVYTMDMTTAQEIFPDGCPWQVEYLEGTPDGDVIHGVVECGAPVELTYGGDGWRCANGHEHIPIEIALAPGGVEWEREQIERHGDEKGAR